MPKAHCDRTHANAFLRMPSFFVSTSELFRLTRSPNEITLWEYQSEWD
jgi:hypothetical protein